VTGITLRRQAAGKPVSASIINEAIAAIERLSRLRVGEGLSQVDVGGLKLLRGRALPPGVKWVYTQAAGIGYATSATVGTVVTESPGSALCFDSTLNTTTGAYSTDTSIPAALKVYNDWTSSTSMLAGVGGKWICVAQAEDGSWRCLGDPC
jgi:hypothetical protein